MKIDAKKIGEINVLTISGRMTLGEPTTALNKAFKEMLDSGEKMFVFDLNDVPFIDSTSLGELVACHKRATERSGEVKLVLAPKGKVWEVMTMTFLHKSFDIHDQVDQALASFAK